MSNDATSREPGRESTAEATGERQGRLEVLKALGDNTRYAIYLELARSSSPRSTADIADILGLHPNTVRPHLERMRDVGLLDVETDAKGSVGRPQRAAPPLGLEPPAFPLLARLLASMAAAARLEPDDAADAARGTGRAMAADRLRRTPGDSCVAALADALDELGFDPAVAGDGEAVTIAFTHCPFAELAEAYPELVCHLHRGLVEGFVAEWGEGGVERFSTLADRDPCQVELSLR